MKLLNTILSVIILALSCMPCTDMEGSRVSHLSAEIASNNDSHPHNGQIDLCSPFCACNCCSTHVVTYFPIIATDLPIVTNVIKISLPTTYKSIFSSNFYGSIWQPPQIA
ncbi:DUF6660 family protein [Flavobacterium granuli]|uniref:DUF2946 domain-containing protein n=1 Tax=Flavobacterium granuli TaxID=280093 RepID=A0ABU1S2T4_9FLAO|nr:DUF6660 family protein [Flavobacterium granuli]MDR6845347.1 hypothetical protein [Flavobacterium granuli]